MNLTTDKTFIDKTYFFYGDVKHGNKLIMMLLNKVFLSESNKLLENLKGKF